MRSALVAVVTLPLGVLTAFIALHLQGVSADILSLSGIAIAISAMVDAAIVMIENAHKHLEHWAKEHNGEQPTGQAHWQLVGKAAAEVGPALFISLVIITLSFLPVFALEGQEGRLFKPLAFTKTYAMAAAAALSVTLVPVLMGYLIRGRIRAEQDNPLNRWLVALYHPLLEIIRRHPLATFGVSLLVLASALWPLNHLGTEFMPAMEEGNALVYMPTTLPGLSYGKAEQLLQQTDRMLRTVPEVERVFGKVGRADSATDPAPLEMFETTITFKPRSQWRAGMTMARLQEELDAAVQVPGLVNFFVPPIRNRIDMQATGIKSPIGIKVLGPEVDTLQEIASHIEHITQDVAGVRSVLAERVASGRYVDVKIRPEAAARFGLSQAQLQDFIQTAVGGMPIGETIEGRERHPIVLRYPRAVRSSVPALESLLIPGKDGLQVRLDQVADVSITSGPAMLTSDNGMLAAYIYVDTADRALGDIVKDLQALVAAEVDLPAGYTLEWSGQFEFLAHAMARLQTVIPITLVIITFLLHLVFRRWDETLLVLASLPFALVGGLWLVWALGQAVSVATIIGFIALGGVAAEFGVIMLIYLRTEWQHQQRMNPNAGLQELDTAIHKGAAQRVRPKAMTMVVVLVGLLPIMVGTGVGHEIMQRIATPMVGGMLTAPLVSMLLLPEAYRWLVRRRLQQTENK